MYLITILLFLIIMFILSTNHKNFLKRKDIISFEYIKNISINFLIAIFFAYCLQTYSEKLFNNSFSMKIQNIIFHLLLVDALYYWIHRTSHRIPFLKKNLHEEHHDVKNLIPTDFLHSNYIEYALNILIIYYLPLFFIDISIIEYNISSLIILIHSIYLHYDTDFLFIPGFINSKYHKNHHEIGGGNYSMVFPIWDNYMNTRIKEKKQRKETKKRNKEKKQRNISVV